MGGVFVLFYWYFIVWRCFFVSLFCEMSLFDVEVMGFGVKCILMEIEIVCNGDFVDFVWCVE